jgi:hypothetical protein
MKAIFTNDSVGLGLKSTIVAWFLLFAISPSELCSTSVEVQATLKSSPTVRLTVLLKGEPQEGAKIKIYRYKLGQGREAKPCFSLISDAQGRVLPPRLSPGHYHVVAFGANNLRGELDLDVSPPTNEKASEFSIALNIRDITREELFAQRDQMPIKDRIRVFRGIVRDPSGDPIPGVFIEIVRKGSRGRGRVARLKSGKDGQFSATLADGSYIGFFSMSNFQSQFIPFEVTEQGTGDLIVTLEVGMST